MLQDMDSVTPYSDLFCVLLMDPVTPGDKIAVQEILRNAYISKGTQFADAEVTFESQEYFFQGFPRYCKVNVCAFVSLSYVLR